MTGTVPAEPALDFHGDAELAAGLVDLAVNVRQDPLPRWLRDPIARSLDQLGRYPDQGPARAAVGARHGRTAGEVLLTAGAAQAFSLVAQAGREARHAVVVHPQFTEAEAALRAVGLDVDRVLLAEADGFRLDPAAVPDSADLVVVGNPTNPTSVRHRAAVLAALARPGRTLVVDEAFADTVPGEPDSLSRRRDLPGLVVIRSLTKTWGLAGLRIGYLLAAPETVTALGRLQPLWPVSTPALAAAMACADPRAVALERDLALALAADREHLLRRLRVVPGVSVPAVPASSFVLVKVAGGGAVRQRLRELGYAVRRGDTFPGLGPDWLRVAVRDPATSDGFADALRACLARDGEA